MVLKNPNCHQVQIVKFNSITHIIHIIQKYVYIGYDNKELDHWQVKHNQDKLQELVTLAMLNVQDTEVVVVFPSGHHGSLLELVTCVAQPPDFTNSLLENVHLHAA